MKIKILIDNVWTVCKAAIVDGKLAPDYWVDPNGNLWSTKGKSGAKMIAWHISGGRKYPRSRLRINNETKNIDLHRLVCFTYHKFPVPNGVTEKEWEITPESVKLRMNELYQVNHIDHDHKNFHPSNLEWVSTKENSQAWQTHSKHRELNINGL